MPGLPERTRISSGKGNNNGSGTDNANSLAVLSNDNRPQYGLSYNQLEEFWCGLTQHDRQKLLRINKQTLLENARKRMYCSRCNGLLLEGYLQIVMYGKSTKQDMPRARDIVRTINVQDEISLCAEDDCQEDAYNPSVHPWGGLTTARDETLTLLDCYICSKSLKGVQNVFDSAYARERDRELLYPDACGGTSRGWITQGTTGFGRGHVSRETCALHTARLSVRTLVDFWSALGEETRHSLMRMKEEDFIERLMYRFDNKRFCRDCRRNVIREFKELKELKRMRKEPRCTIWFCAADTDFQYEVCHDTVKADWNQAVSDSIGTYHHFEWAIGTGEGKADIVDFEDVGLSVRVQVNGLDLSDLTACYITLRAWKMNGRCNELCVKAHALRGQHCVHSRLVVGDGFVTITQGESIERFFEHAEEAEEEEDDDSMDKDGNDFDGECSRPQKHAKSPELAREFLLDAATVIFKEQVSKAFREGTTRQNAHIIFVSLALQLLEERLHVACKEIYTIENQKKLLEEEEKEKRMEEKLKERQERKRTKEREKKLRKKERLREKENKCIVSGMDDTAVTDAPVKDSTGCPDDSPNFSQSTASETSEPTQASPLSPDVQDDELLTEFIYSKTEEHSEDTVDHNLGNTGDWNSSFSYDHHKYSRRNMKFHKDSQPDWINWSGRRKGDALSDNATRYGADDFESTRGTDGSNKQLTSSAMKSNTRISGQKMGKKCQCSYTCRCYYQSEHKPRPASYATRVVQEPKYVSKSESTLDVSKPYYRGNKYTQVECSREVGNRTNSYISGNPPNTKKVWEPLDSQKKYVRRNSDSDVTLKSTQKDEASESDQFNEFSGAFNDAVTDISVSNNQLDDDDVSAKSLIFSRKAVSENGELSLDSSTNSSSNSDNCSSCLIEGDSNTQNLEVSSASDSEESSQNSDGKEATHCFENGLTECEVTNDTSRTTASEHDAGKIQEQTCAKAVSSNHLNPKVAPYIGNGGNIVVSAPPPQMHNQTIHYPIFQAPTINYYPQSPVPWPVGPANGLVSFPHANHYMYPNGYGYGLNGNPQFTQYGTLQHLAPPLLSPVHAPVFQPVPQFNEVGSIEESKVPNVGGQKGVQCDTERVASTDQLHGPVVLGAAESRKPQKMDKGNDGFSLFHYGGPVALSTGFEAEPLSLKREISPKKDSMEEYNLFAASNGIKFDIFQLE